MYMYGLCPSFKIDIITRMCIIKIYIYVKNIYSKNLIYEILILV